MKKLIILAAIAVFGFSNVNAQEGGDSNGVDKVIDQAKEGGFYVGANFGFSVINSSRNPIYNDYYNNDDFGSFNFGFDVAYLFEVIPNLEVGLLVGYTHFIADGNYYGNNGKVKFEDASFVPISTSARYYFLDRKLFGGLDLGYAVNVSGDDGVDGGLYFRPKFGYNLGAVTLIASFQKVGGNSDYYDNDGDYYYSIGGFSSFNVGAEFSF